MQFFIKFFICGIFTSLIFPPFFLIPLGFIIFPYVFGLLIQKEYTNLGYKNHFFSGFLFGLGFFLVFLQWIKEPFLVNESFKNYYLLSYLLIVYCSLYFGFVFFLLKYFKNILIKLITFPALIVLSEYLCSNFVYGFPWTSFSLVHSANSMGTSIIYYLGTYGLSYVTILFFLFPFIFLLNRNKYKTFLIFFYFLLIITVLFFILIIKNDSKNTKDEKISISIVQLNLPTNHNFNIIDIENNYQNIFKIIKNNKNNLIIFAENNFPKIMNNKEIKKLQNIMKDDTNLIIGATSKQNKNFYNSLFLINNKSHKNFDKKILVPFGEFIPFRFIFNFMDFIAGSTDYSIGKKKRMLVIDDKIKILPVICYEIIYFWKLLNESNLNTNLIVNLTNDSWFGNVSGPYQHFYFTKLRAAEFNKLIIRVSNNGISSVINNRGQIVDFIPLNTTKIKNIEISIPTINKTYIFIHKFFLFYILLTLLIALYANKNNDYQ